MTTAPFDPAVAALASDSHTAVLTAVAVSGATTVPLDVLDYSVAWDENRNPHTTASLDCAVPDQAALDLLDPRTMVRVKITVSYTLPSGHVDAQQVADLGLRSRRVSRPDNTLTLECASDEALVIDNSPDAPYFEGQSTFATPVAYVNSALTARLAGGPAASPTIVNRLTSSGGAFLVDSFPTDWWSTIVDALDALDADLYDPGDRTFYLEPRAYATAESVHVLTVGPRGNIVSSDAGVGREDWANAVTILWRWDNTSNPGQPDRTWGLANVTGGPWAPSVAGYKTYTETRPGKVNSTTATAVAQNVLRRVLARGRTYRIVAVAAWWVRAKDTVTIQLPTGDQERHLVAAVEFRGDGLMTLTTRQPDTLSTIG
ncbi:MAG: hypothetical protein IE926_05710 [Micrococcales bacterium]|nr:hypothetical protein [Micrococcales bacterium]